MDPILARLPVADRDRINSALRRAMSGDAAYDETFSIVLEDGSMRWLHGLGRKVEGADSDKFIGVTYDVTAEHEVLAERELMLREMNHRVKNLFAVITAIIRMQARHVDDVGEFAEQLCERIWALGRSHSLTVDNRAGEADLREVISAAIEPSVNGQAIALEGEAVRIPNSAITPLAMIFHEWVTNATKYGALSVEGGTLSVEWSKPEDDRVILEWRETGRNGKSGDGDGFGARLVDASARQISAKAEVSATETGYYRALTFKLD